MWFRASLNNPTHHLNIPVLGKMCCRTNSSNPVLNGGSGQLIFFSLKIFTFFHVVFKLPSVQGLHWDRTASTNWVNIHVLCFRHSLNPSTCFSFPGSCGIAYDCKQSWGMNNTVWFFALFDDVFPTSTSIWPSHFCRPSTNSWHTMLTPACPWPMVWAAPSVWHRQQSMNIGALSNSAFNW